MNYLNTALLIILFGSCCQWAIAQPEDGKPELTPEERDAAYTAEDAARDATRWSDEIIDRGPSDPLVRMSDGVDLIVHGTVVSQSYSYDGDNVPYTHTTFSVNDVLKGSLAQDEFTLVQEGGPAKNDERRFMTVSHGQHFNIGEEELLYVRLPTGAVKAAASGRPAIDEGDTSMRASVHSVSHRFRIYGGKVYDQDGRGLIMEAGAAGVGTLNLSADRHPAARFRDIHIGSITLTKRFSDEQANPASADAAPGSPPSDTRGGSAQAAGASYTDSTDIDSLVTAIAAATN